MVVVLEVVVVARLYGHDLTLDQFTQGDWRLSCLRCGGWATGMPIQLTLSAHVWEEPCKGPRVARR